MAMRYTDGLQVAVIDKKIALLMGAVIEAMTDGDEALEARKPEPLERAYCVDVRGPLVLQFNGNRNAVARLAHL